MKITYRYSDRGARAATANLRREIGKDARAAGRDVARKQCVPPARTAAPSVYRDAVKPHATTRGVGVRIGGSREIKSIAGWLEFGGAIRAKGRGFLTFQVDGRWVRVRTVHRARSRDGHYIGRVMTSPALVGDVHRTMQRELTRVLDKHLTRSGASVQ